MTDADTIAAISTTPGESGIGIVRLSGKEAVKTADKLFSGISGNKLSKAKTFSLHYGFILDAKDNSKVDEVIVSVMRAPRTYTKEDVVEINCHGGIVPLRKVLELCIKNGARLAAPGEFTKRAYLSGRIDLAQAEAVADVIRAKTEKSLQAAIKQLSGGLSERIKDLNIRLKDILAQVEANIEFPEQEIETTDLKGIKNETKKVISGIEKLLFSAETGKILREGVKTAIVGKPNVGKSSLLNTIIKEERAIVTHIPGTTRDTIEESVSIKGIPFVMIDTAGIRESKDIVEKKGIERSKRSIDEADLVIFMLDASSGFDREDEAVLNNIKGKKYIVVINKIDLKNRINAKALKTLANKGNIIKTSLAAHTGIKDLENRMINTVLAEGIKSADEALVTNIRHKDLLEKAKESLQHAIKTIDENMSEEFIAVDLKAALDSLGEITGKTTAEDILNTIFSSFCVGK